MDSGLFVSISCQSFNQCVKYKISWFATWFKFKVLDLSATIAFLGKEVGTIYVRKCN